ncbi:MAG TPA: FtsX-like permease family protein [Cyclobacteriaceae bacterium]
MNLSYFIAKRISREQKEGFSSIINVIAIVTIAIGLGACIISFLIMTGFQETVKEKIYSFSSHLRVTKFTMSNATEEQPFFYNIDLYNHPEKYPMVDHVQEYAQKAGLIKTDDEVMGVVFKGVGKSFDVNRFKENLVEGEFLHLPDSGYAREILLSKTIAGKLKIKTGDEIMVHFFQNPPRLRRLKVSGLYETNLSEYFDGKMIIGDIRLIKRLEDWADSVAGGLEVYVKDINHVDADMEFIGESMDYDLYIEKTSDTYVQVFEWLDLVSRQVVILLVIILIVVCVNIISVVLILVMERTQMVGMLKALGAKDKLVRSVFVYNGINLILKGLLFGNLLGLGLCYLQSQFHFIRLNAKDYYMSYVPIGWNWEAVIFLNILVFVIVTLVLLLPTAIVSRINPIKAIRFD